jgi:hypothetical protein
LDEPLFQRRGLGEPRDRICLIVLFSECRADSRD